MRRTKIYAPAAKTTTSPVQEGVRHQENARQIFRAPAGPAPKPVTPVAKTSATTAQTEVNQEPDFAAAALVPRGGNAASGRVELVRPGAVFTAPSGMDLRGFVHRNGNAVKFAGAAGAVSIGPTEAEHEFGPLMAEARALLAANPPPPKATLPTKKPAAVHRAAMSDAAPTVDAGAQVESAMSSSAGASLPQSTRSRLESSFNTDLGQVRVHTDSSADRAAQAVNAHAFTTGQDIYFRSGQYRPNASDGMKLIAHETAHTIQQRNGESSVAKQADSSELQVSEPGSRHEREAETAANHVMLGRRAEVTPATGDGTIARLAVGGAPTGSVAAPQPAVKSSAEGPPKAEKSPPAPMAKPAQQPAGMPSSDGSKAGKPETPAKSPAAKAGPENAPENAAEKTPAKGGSAKAAPGSGGEKGAADSEGGGKNAKAGPEPKAPAKAGAPAADAKNEAAEGKEEPAADAGLQAVVGQVKETAHKQKTHPPAAAKAAEASAAAKGPPDEVAAKARGGQVGVMDQQKAGTFDRDAFLKTLLSRIEAVTPQTLEEADDFKKKGKAGAIKGDLTQQVAASKESAQGNVAAAAKAEPSTAGIEAKQTTDLPPVQATPVAEVAAAKAVPPPVPEEKVSLAEQSQAIDDRMSAANVSREQLDKSNEPAFQKAAADKDAAQANAAKAPGEYRAAEQKTLAGAKAENQAAVGKQLSEMVGSRGKALGGVLDKQTAAKTADEEKRAAVTKGLQDIYEQTKKDVEERLAKLDTDVNAAFDTAAGKAQKSFEDHVADRMKKYKDERYEGLTGAGRWLKDKFMGLPPEVNAFYAEGKQKYIDSMRSSMEGIATLVGQGIDDAKAKIAAGKKKVDEYIRNQPKDLQDVAKDAAGKILEQFEQLEQQVNDKQEQIVEGLVNRYQEKLKELDEKITAMKAENGGLLDSVMEAVGGVIQTILELKAMLLGVLAKAGGAVELIISDPIGFLGNLVDGVKLGVTNFVKNIGKHLKDGFFAWLFGTLAAAGIQMPKNFDLKGVLGLVLQILGLTYANFRSRAVKIVGEKVVSAIETASVIFVKLVTEGPAALWEYIKEQASNLIESLIDGIKTFLIEKVIVAGVTWIIGLLNPASAFIKACKAIYDVVMFFIERGQQILALVNAVLDSVTAIAKGTIGVAAKFVEDALAKAVPVAIGFLASLLGLGGLSDKIKKLIEKIQAPVNKAIDWVITKAVALVKAAGKMLGFGKEKSPGKQEAAMLPAVTVETALSMDGEGHTLVTATGGSQIVTSMSSNEQIKDLQTGINAGMGEIERLPYSESDKKHIKLQLNRLLKALSLDPVEVEKKLTGGRTDTTISEAILKKYISDRQDEAKVELYQLGNKHHIKSIKELFEGSGKVPPRRYLPVGFEVREQLYQKGTGYHSEMTKCRLRYKKAIEAGKVETLPSNFIPPAEGSHAEVMNGEKYEVDHIISLANHWSNLNGNNSGDVSRKEAVKDGQNLQLLTVDQHKEKTKIDQQYEYVHWVGSEFTSEQAEKNLPNARKIQSKPFLKEAGGEAL